MEGQMTIFDLEQDIWSGRTYTEHSVRTEEKILGPSWKKWQGSAKKESLFLDLRKESGQIVESSSGTHLASHTGYLMPSTGGFLNVGSVSALSLILMGIRQQTSSLIVNTQDSPVMDKSSRLADVLEMDADQKYRLSSKACRGIIRRAMKRGKDLPEMLVDALLQTVSRAGEMDLLMTEIEEYLPSKNEVGNQGGVKEYSSKMTGQGRSHPSANMLSKDVSVYKGDGDTGEGNTFAIVGNHESRISDYTNLIISLDRESMNSSYNLERKPGVHTDGIMPTITKSGIGAMCYQDKVGCLEARDCKGIGSEYVGGASSSCRKNPATVPGNVYGFFPQKKAEGMSWTRDKSTTLVNGTNYGFQNAICYTMQAFGNFKDCGVGSSLKKRDYKDATDLVVQDTTGVDVYNQRITGDKTMTLTGVACEPHHVPCVISYPQYVVRRLTPLECERLQGFPDYWTLIDDYIDSNGKKQTASDSKRYQALGNSIALPSWKWVLKRISAQYETDPTMASLFDGIGGFPYLWEGINGKGTCLWSSEIEDFQNAVTKERIG